MPRKSRVFVAGAGYHVYCRVARGERPFADPVVAETFVETVAAVKDEHGLIILAWCVMPNHYHLVLRAGELPLWRSMRLVQGRFAKAFNRRERVLGPVWQSRYKARLVEDADYLMSAMAYVHLNPVASHIVKDPAAYRWSGHRQILGRVRGGLVNVNEALLIFGPTRRRALSGYRRVLGRGKEGGWMGETPGRLPWWRRRSGDDDELKPDPTRPRLDWQGVAHRPEPAKGGVADVVGAVASVLGVPALAVGGRSRADDVREARELVMLVGVEAMGLKVRELAKGIGRGAGSASRIYGEAAMWRRADPGRATLVNRVIEELGRVVRGKGPNK